MRASFSSSSRTRASAASRAGTSSARAFRGLLGHFEPSPGVVGQAQAHGLAGDGAHDPVDPEGQAGQGVGPELPLDEIPANAIP